MNSKNSLFLSASLTAFVLAVLFGVVTRVTNTPTTAAAAPVVAAVAPTATDVPPTDVPPTDEILPTATVQGPLGPEEAAALAAQAINRQDVYSVESFLYNNTTDSYKVVFSSGDIVYMGMDRQVLEITKVTPVVVSVPAVDPTKPPKKHRGGGGGSTGGTNNPPPAPTSPPTQPPDDGGHDD